MDLQSNLVTLRCGPKTAVDLAAVPKAIRESGFRPEAFTIVATGQFDASGQTFTPLGWSRGLTVGADRPETTSEGGSVHLVASITGWEDGDGPLQLSAIEPADD